MRPNRRNRGGLRTSPAIDFQRSTKKAAMRPFQCSSYNVSRNHARLIRGPYGPLMSARSCAARIRSAKRALRFEIVALRVGFVALDVDADRSAGGAGARQAEDDARAAFEQDADALVLAHRFVDRIVIGEVIGMRDLEALDRSAGKRWRAWRADRPSACWRRPYRRLHNRGANNSCGRRSPNARARSPGRSTLRTARILSQSSTAQRPSFSRTWLEPVPELSSPQIVAILRHRADCRRISSRSGFHTCRSSAFPRRGLLRRWSASNGRCP